MSPLLGALNSLDVTFDLAAAKTPVHLQARSMEKRKLSNGGAAGLAICFLLVFSGAFAAFFWLGGYEWALAKWERLVVKDKEIKPAEAAVYDPYSVEAQLAAERDGPSDDLPPPVPVKSLGNGGLGRMGTIKNAIVRAATWGRPVASSGAKIGAGSFQKRQARGSIDSCNEMGLAYDEETRGLVSESSKLENERFGEERKGLMAVEEEEEGRDSEDYAVPPVNEKV